MVSTWMGNYSSVEVDAVVNNTVKSQEWRMGPPKHAPGAKKQTKKGCVHGPMKICQRKF